MTQNWKRVWDNRRLDPSAGSTLAQLMTADGLDTGFGSVSEDSWRAFVRSAAADLAVAPGESVFEVGCGAGAFLLDLYERGVTVAGIDQSAALVGFAREAMPNGRFAVADAAAFDADKPYDVVVACGVFLYFPDLTYASEVIGRMCRKARRAVGIFDTPDLAKRDAALALRRASMGPEEYEARYAGLDHLYYGKEWMRDALAAHGLGGVRVDDQRVAGYANASYRFNAIGFRK
jgi:SAM-dependent methyltransferase